MGIKGADLKNESLLQVFAAVCGTLMQGKAANRHVFFEMIKEIKMPRDWFRCVFVILLNVTLMFSESVAQSSSCFANVQLFTQCAGYAIDNICRGTRETISDLNSSLRARYFVSVLDERTSFASRARAFPYIRVPQTAAKTQSKDSFLTSAPLIPTASTNAFHSIKLFLFFANSTAPCSVYKPSTTHNSSIRSDEGLTLETSAFQFLYGGQFTLSTLLINRIFLHTS